MTAPREVLDPVPDDFAIVEGDDVSMFSAEGQAIIRAAEARIALGIPSPTVIVTMHKTWADARREGRAEGRAEEAARAVLTALRVRGIPVPDAARERILAQKDLERLVRWQERSIVAGSIAEVLDDPS